MVNCRVVNGMTHRGRRQRRRELRPAPLVERSAVEIDRDGSLSRRRARRRGPKARRRQLVVGLNERSPRPSGRVR